jgi:hypothetical protein
MIRKSGHRFSGEIALKQTTGHGGLQRFTVRAWSSRFAARRRIAPQHVLQRTVSQLRSH